MANTPSCPVCACASRKLAKTKSGFDVCRCTSCALVFSDPMPSPEELDDYYQGFTYAMPGESEFAAQAAFVENNLAPEIEHLKRLSSQPIRKVLDFGGGLGFFANALSKHFDSVTYFDLDDHSRTIARQRFGDHFEVAETAHEALDSTYDLILLNQVVEHIPDPGKFLAQFKASLAPGGILVVTTPNNSANDNSWRPDVALHYARRLTSMPKALKLMATDSWLCCDPPRHLFAFNRKNLSALAQSEGFAIKEVATSYFDEDPYGQPKYRAAGFSSLRSALDSVLNAWSTAAASIAKRTAREEQGSTLLVYLTVQD